MDLITKVEHLPDRTKIHYFLRQPWGYLNITDTIEVLHSEVANLKPPPEIGKSYPEWYEEVEIPAIGKTLIFLCSSMRSGGGPPDEAIDGPYLNKVGASDISN